jgi:hypothetical protein
LAKCREALLKVPYGFQHVRPNISVGKYLLPDLVEADDPLAVHRQAEKFQDGLLNLRQRMLGRLMQIAELVETAGGLKPIPIPKDRPQNAAR